MNKNTYKDKLFLLSPDFHNPEYPGQSFYCWHCALLEGVLISYPNIKSRLDIERVPWPKPRKKIVELLGLNHQDLPLLVLVEGNFSKLQSGPINKLNVVIGKDKIISAFTELYGLASPHP